MWSRLDQRRQAHKGTSERVAYLRGGYGRLFDALAEDIAARGGTIHTSTAARRLVLDGTRVTGVETDSGTLAADLVIYAGQLPRLGDLVDPVHRDPRWARVGPRRGVHDRPADQAHDRRVLDQRLRPGPALRRDHRAHEPRARRVVRRPQHRLRQPLLHARRGDRHRRPRCDPRRVGHRTPRHVPPPHSGRHHGHRHLPHAVCGAARIRAVSAADPADAEPPGGLGARHDCSGVPAGSGDGPGRPIGRARHGSRRPARMDLPRVRPAGAARGLHGRQRKCRNNVLPAQLRRLRPTVLLARGVPSVRASLRRAAALTRRACRRVRGRGRRGSVRARRRVSWPRRVEP